MSKKIKSMFYRGFIGNPERIPKSFIANAIFPASIVNPTSAWILSSTSLLSLSSWLYYFLLVVLLILFFLFLLHPLFLLSNFLHPHHHDRIMTSSSLYHSSSFVSSCDLLLGFIDIFPILILSFRHLFRLLQFLFWCFFLLPLLLPLFSRSLSPTHHFSLRSPLSPSSSYKVVPTLSHVCSLPSLSLCLYYYYYYYYYYPPYSLTPLLSSFSWSSNTCSE